MFLILLSRSRYTSEYYFFQVLLADIIAYSTRKAKCLDISLLIVNSEVDLTTSSPISTSVIYTDSSFINTSPDVSLPSMTSVWMALNDILESSFACLPSTFPSTLRSEIATLLYTLCALVSSFSVFLYTDYASIIFFWHQYIDRPFLPDFLKQTILAHADDILNNQVNALSKSAYISFQPTIAPIVMIRSPCALEFNSLLIDDNIHHFLKSIYKAKNLLFFSSFTRFVNLDTLLNFNWSETPSTFLFFRLALFLCNTTPENLTHLWTCPYILLDISSQSVYRSLITSFRDNCIAKFSALKTLPDSFDETFSAFKYWNFITPSISCLWLTSLT
ncbi:hypothetical protein GLOIN_2v1785823 [Rhizophagus irregularis DAOM 181602=DAOM 197198]|nr:hypothetical protein GLOIN_2v1785823 [Rhizophagus irregularis DAOM 181602=DAOM 197198]